MSRAKPVYRDMTALEQSAALALAQCRMQNFDRRFSDCLEKEALQAEPRITDKQANCLWRKIWKFRKQILAQDDGSFRNKVRITAIMSEVKKRSFTSALDETWELKREAA